MSIRAYMVLLVVAATILPVVIGLAAMSSARPVAQSGEGDEELARMTAWLIMRDVLSTQRVVKLGTQLFDLTSMYDDEVTGVLRMLYKQDEDLDAVVLLDENDDAIVDPVYLGDDQIQPGSSTQHHLPVDDGDLVQFLEHLPLEEARESGQALSGIYINKRKNVAMVAGAIAVMYREGKKVWILGFERSLRRVQQIISAGVLGGHYLIFVVDEGGRMIAHPDGKLFIDRHDASQHPLVARYIQGEKAGSLSWVDSDGADAAGAFRRLDTLGWAVVVQRSAGLSASSQWRLPGWGWVAWCVMAVFIAAALFLVQRRVQILLHDMQRLGDDAEHRAEALKRLQASLLETGKLSAIGDLGAGVAHEFNNPIGGILGLTQLLLRKKKEGDSDLQFLKRIEQEAKRCKVITDNLLRFSEHQGIEYKEPLRLHRVTANTLDMLAKKLESQRISVERSFDESLPRVIGNEGQIQRAILNVLLNAETAMPEGGKLHLTTKMHGDWVVLCVEDSGRGIPPENLDRVFEPFFTTKDEWKGAGLGLSVVYQIMKDHEGLVNVNSTTQKGTTVTLSFVPEDRSTKEEVASRVPLA